MAPKRNNPGPQQVKYSETKLDAMVRDKVEQIVNAMLDEEADLIANAARYERSDGRKAYRAGHYARGFTVKAGRLALRIPKLKGAVFESAVIERYRRREQSVEESLIDMYLAGVSTRRVDDISQLLWGERMPSQTLSDKLKRVYDQIDQVVPEKLRKCGSARPWRGDQFASMSLSLSRDMSR